MGERLQTSFSPYSWLKPLTSFTVKNKSNGLVLGIALKKQFLQSWPHCRKWSKILLQKIIIWRGEEIYLFLSLEEIASTEQLPFLSLASRKLTETLQAQHAFDFFLVCMQKSTALHTANNFLKSFCYEIRLLVCQPNLCCGRSVHGYSTADHPRILQSSKSLLWQDIDGHHVTVHIVCAWCG